MVWVLDGDRGEAVRMVNEERTVRWRRWGTLGNARRAQRKGFLRECCPETRIRNKQP